MATMAELSQQQAANLELARTLLDAFQRGDLEAARAFIDPDSEVTSDPGASTPASIAATTAT